VFPNLHVIHEVRDGRDVALSNLNSTNLRTTRKFQRHYIQTFAGGPVMGNDSDSKPFWFEYI
jgi:hypothetical protein